MSPGTKSKRDLAAPLAGAEDFACAGGMVMPCGKDRARRKANPSRLVFLRLFEDVIDELNAAVQRRLTEGVSKSEIAERGDIAPALLSRVLKGRSGTNLRTIAAVLAGTDYRFKIESVPCEQMTARKAELADTWAADDSYHFVQLDGVWREPLTNVTIPQLTSYSEVLVDG
jgi:hypothetical protein